MISRYGRWIGLAWRMLRYRVALMLWLFFLLGAAAHGGLDRFQPSYLWAVLALSASYVSATTVNDVADKDIDLVNHPASPGRPLVNGEANEGDLYRLHLAAVAGALVFSLPLGREALALTGLSLLIGLVYSIGPLRLSYRTYLAPLVLAVAYVLLPYGLGTVAAGAAPSGRGLVLAGALFLFFVGRINLKDFRDRAGDAMYGKPTLLLRFGKPATCWVSFAAIAAGNVLLFAALDPGVVLGGLLELYLVAVYAMLLRLRATEGHDAEQTAIGTLAKMGNGLLVTVLGLLVLESHGAPLPDQLIFATSTAAAYGLAFAVLITHPDQAVIGYRG
jgi:4-hydroxybenzoate polyprenyltransferase